MTSGNVQQPIYPKAEEANASAPPPYWHPQQPGYTGVPQSEPRYAPPMGQGQPGVVFVPQKGQQVVVMRQRESFVKHIVLSCVVSWCCCWPLGLVAFILAMVANSRADATDEVSIKKAHDFGVHSIRTSIAGIVLGVILIITYVVLQFVVFSHSKSDPYDP